MNTSTARPVPLPLESKISELYVGAHLVDSFAITLPAGAPPTMDSIARAVLGDPSPLFRTLLACRDVLVTPFGIKSSKQHRDELYASGMEYIDFFPVLARGTSEVVVGANDHHLDFHTSVLLRSVDNNEQNEVVVTSVVHCHNFLGRSYLCLIAPFHRLIVRSNLSRAAAKAWHASSLR